MRQTLADALTPGGRLPAELIVNDLEGAAISLCPLAADARRALRDAGADHAMVSGSGPTVFGLFWGDDASARAEASAIVVSAQFSGAASAVGVAAAFGHPRLSAQSGD
jgi:4-diphosphocytidyl-2-C-methyl-D-erythritol kinase